MSWAPTPEDLLFRVERYVDGAWMECGFGALKVGDIFRTFDRDGDQIFPPDDDDVGCVTEAPFRSPLGRGYSVMADAAPLSYFIDKVIN